MAEIAENYGLNVAGKDAYRKESLEIATESEASEDESSNTTESKITESQSSTITQDSKTIDEESSKTAQESETSNKESSIIAQESGTTAEESSAEERHEDKRAKVLKLHVIAVIRKETEQEMNLSHAKVVEAVALKLRFDRKKLEEIRANKYGGGKPHMSFMESFVRNGDGEKSIKEISDALLAAKMKPAQRYWIELTKNMKDISDLLEEDKLQEFEDFCDKRLIEIPTNPMIKSFVDLASELRMTEKVEDARKAIVTPAGYSPAGKLFTFMQQGGYNTDKFIKALKEVDADKTMIDCKNILKLVEDDIEFKMIGI